MMQAQDVIDALRLYAVPEKREDLMRYFQTGTGKYGEGDTFIGVAVPNVQAVAKQYNSVVDKNDNAVLSSLLRSEIHEVRHCALFIIVQRMKRKATLMERKAYYDFYLQHLDCINNWDLVDCSAPDIIGKYLLECSTLEPMYELFRTDELWRRRVAILSALTFIRNGDPRPTIQMAEWALTDSRDLIQKATGWMLREMGKRNEDALLSFMDKYSRSMPRTMLRYAVEKLSPAVRQSYMRK